MKYISLFAGVGGFDLALNRLGHECVYANDFDKYCKIIYDKNFSNRSSTENKGQSERTPLGNQERQRGKLFDDGAERQLSLDTTSISDVPTSAIPDHDLLVGGFPCQSFSIAGKRGGFDDTRGTLFFDIARIIKEKRTKYLILENVKGLLSHDSGRTFKTILSTLTELGYDIQTMVLNSKNFGVPQNRERVFIVGHLRGLSRPKVFPIGSNDEVRTRPNPAKKEIHAGTLTARQFASWNGNYIRQMNKPKHSNDRVYATDGISPTLNTMQGGMRQPFIQNPKMMNYKKDYKNSVAITATSYKEPPVVNGIRRLTPIECERLQGFPDNWTEGVSDTQRYKMMGNAVTVNVVYEVARRMFV